jgi:hypothetical protein
MIEEAPHNKSIRPFNRTKKMRSPCCALKLAANKQKDSPSAKSGRITIIKNGSSKLFMKLFIKFIELRAHFTASQST